MHVLLVKPSIDSKGADKIISRLGTTRQVDILATPRLDIAASIRQWSKDVEEVGCVLVDEAQFLAPLQVDQLLELTVKDNIPVIAYGLRADFLTRGFPGSLRLFELAHTIEELKTICRCGRKALFNGRRVNGKYIFKGEQIAIDGENEVEYESLCANCYLNKRALI